MPRAEVTLAFVGSGKVDKKNATDLLRDWIDANGGAVKAILPLTRSYWNPSLETVAGFLVENDIPIEAVVDDTTGRMREIKPFLSVARRQHQSNAVAHKLAALLDEARDARLVVCWNDEDDTVHDTVREVAKCQGVDMLDMTDGLDRIDLQTEEPEEEEFEEPESDEIPEPEAEEDEAEETEDEESAGEEGDEEESEDEVEAEDDVEAEAEAEEESYDELPEEEEFELPEEDEDAVLTVLMETEAGTMTEFQTRLIILLEKLVDAFLAEAGVPAQMKAPVKRTVKPAAAAPAKAATAPTTRKISAKKAVAPPVKRTVKPAPKAAAPTAKKAPAKKAAASRAEDNGARPMSKAAAQKIMDAYRPKRGRPPAEVTEARKVLGLI